MPKDYEIGYGKPPEHSQFKKGQSGNPKGKPKGCRNFSTDAKKVAKLPTRIIQDGIPKTVSSQYAALLRLREKALAGDPRSLDRYIDIVRTYNDDEVAEVAAALSATDREIVNAFKVRVRRENGELPGKDQDAGNNDSTKLDKANGVDETPEKGDDDDWLK